MRERVCVCGEGEEKESCSKEGIYIKRGYKAMGKKRGKRMGKDPIRTKQEMERK